MSKKRFRQGDAIVRNLQVNRRGIIYQKSLQLLAYADDIDRIGRTQRDVNSAFVSIEAEAAKLSLKVNKGKLKSPKKGKPHRKDII